MKRIIAVLTLILLVAATVIPAGALHVELGKAPSLVIMGDSISKGFGVDETMSYAYIVSQEIGAENYKNIAQNGLTSTGLVNKFNQATYCNNVKSADIILFTIGGNDLIASFLKITSAYVGQNITSIDEGANFLSVLTTAQLNEMLSSDSAKAEMANMLATFKTNLDTVFAKTKELNAGADIIILTQYNPMSGVESLKELDVAADPIFVQLNAILTESATAAGAQIIDIYSDLKGVGGVYTFIEGGDIHPNPDGHERMAKVIVEYLENNVFNRPEWTVPETTTEAPTEPVTDPVETTPAETTTAAPAEKGCAGVGVMAILAAATVGAAFVIFKKK